MTESRTKNTKRNIIVSLIFTVINLIFQFISRTIIVWSLGEQYLGLSSLFASVLQVLNMAELGFAGAIVYNMYKPIADKDTETVCALLAYYRKVYRTVGVIILIVGLILIPFVPYLINGNYPSDSNLYFLFFLYLLNVVVSYFLFAYKSSLLEAVQRLDLVKLSYILVNIFQYILQIVSLVLFKDYYLFVIIMIVGTSAKNIVAAGIAKKYFPQYECRGELQTDTKKNVISRVKGLMICNISNVTYTTFDSIILSMCIGLSSVAIYNNYLTVMSGVTAIITLVRGAMQASVGNSVAKESVEKNYQDMLLWQFMFSMIACWFGTCMLCLYQPFMKLWMGSNMLLGMDSVILICIWFYIGVIENSFFLYLSGVGLWWELRWPYICSTISNIVLNVVLGKFFGSSGIIFASLLSSIIFGFIWQCCVIFKNYFHKTPCQFYRCQIVYFFVAILIALICYILCFTIHVDGTFGLVVKLLICSCIPCLLIIIAYFWTDVFKRVVTFLRNAVKV